MPPKPKTTRQTLESISRGETDSVIFSKKPGKVEKGKNNNNTSQGI